MNIVGYIRVSTEEQKISLDAQRKSIIQYCDLYGFKLVEIIADEGQSAASVNRPGLISALGCLGDTAEGLIVTKLDRLTRSLTDFDTLLKRYFGTDGYEFVSIGERVDTSTATGRMVTNILMSVLQWEREIIGERTSSALRHKQSKGEYIGGGLPYGYSVDEYGLLADNEQEQAIVKAAKALRDAGATYRGIAKVLADGGMLNRKGKPFHHEQIRRILAT